MTRHRHEVWFEYHRVPSSTALYPESKYGIMQSTIHTHTLYVCVLHVICMCMCETLNSFPHVTFEENCWEFYGVMCTFSAVLKVKQTDLIRSLGRRREWHRGRLPEAMVNSLGWDWLRSWIPLQCLESWARRFKIERGQRPALSLFVLEDAWMVVLWLPVFPNGQYFGWEETPAAA